MEYWLLAISKARESRWAHDQHIITRGGPVGPWGWLFLRLTNTRLIDTKPVPPDHHYMSTQTEKPLHIYLTSNRLDGNKQLVVSLWRKIIYISQQANGLCLYLDCNRLNPYANNTSLSSQWQQWRQTQHP